VIALADGEVVEGVRNDRLVAPIAMIVGESHCALQVDHLAIDTDLLHRLTDRCFIPTLM